MGLNKGIERGRKGTNRDGLSGRDTSPCLKLALFFIFYSRLVFQLSVCVWLAGRREEKWKKKEVKPREGGK